eukprot:GHRR01024702.1.p1 GENE.GHRR01024702.1~~GHRR01024702.1.p1  ORF type:complete len:286 (+),score=119.27 GHRR01024702.1:47-859(+)
MTQAPAKRSALGQKTANNEPSVHTPEKKTGKRPGPGSRPTTVKDKSMQKTRALSLIAKHAGAYAAEAQKSKWVVGLVMKVDEQYKQGLADRDSHIATLQQQLQEQRESSSAAMQELKQQSDALQCKVQEQELDLYNTTYLLSTAQAQHAVMQDCLQYAEEAAVVATNECATLAAAVQALTEQDARARSSLAHRAHHLRLALLQTNAALRGFHEKDRKDRNVKEWRLKQKEKGLAAERAALLEQQAAQQARDDALETLQLKYHLAAMKLHE